MNTYHKPKVSSSHESKADTDIQKAMDSVNTGDSNKGLMYIILLAAAVVALVFLRRAKCLR